MKRSFILTWILLLTVAAAALAQGTGRLRGAVTRSDGTGVGNVVVRLEPSDRTAVTDGSGNYAFNNVPAGRYTVHLTLDDHSDALEGIEVGAGATATADKTVDWDVSLIETITVTTASRRAERIVDAPAAVTVIPEAEIAREASSGQLPKLLEFTPGVDFSQSGLYDINFNTRGFNSSLNRRILTLIDGRDPAVPFLGSQEWAAVSFPLDELKSVELVRGPGAALYGANAFNGVLNMVTKQPRGTEGGQLRLTAGDLDTRRGDFRWATGLSDNWYAKLVGGYQRADDFTRSRNQRSEYSTLCNPGQTSSQTNPCMPREARALALTEGEIAFGGLRFDGYVGENGVFTLEGGTATLEGPTFQTGIGRVQVTDVERPWVRTNFNTPHWNFLGYYDQRKAKDQVALASGALLWEDSSNLHGEVQGNYGFAGGKGFLVGGAAYHEQDVDTSNAQGFHTLMAEAKSENQQAVFGQLEYSFTDKLKAVAAARWDDSTLHDAEFSPKGALVYSITPNQTVRATYNQAFQVPNYSEFFLRAPAGTPLNLSAIENAFRPFLGPIQLGFANVPILALGNENLEVEKIKSYEVGYSGIFAGKAFVTVDYYQSQIDNFVTDLLPAVNPTFPAYRLPAGVPAQVAAQILATLRANLPATAFAGFTNLGNGAPAIVLSYANAGQVDTQGIDVALNYYVTNEWIVDFSYSWFDFDVKEQQRGDQLLPNAPENKLSAGLAYNADRWNAGLKFRWVDDFFWAAGVFVGPVPSYEVFDLSGRFKITDHIEVGLDISNLADSEDYQSFGGDLLARRALGSVTFSW